MTATLRDSYASPPYLPFDDQALYHALLTRDLAYDGRFWAGVTSTRIFCRPTCPGRKPRRENVIFFADPASALAAGFRPCKRCNPLSATVSGPPAWLIKMVDDLACTVGTAQTTTGDWPGRHTPAQLRRELTKHYGISFAQYSRAFRLGAAARELARGRPVSDVAFSKGFDSLSGFRDAFVRAYHRQPSAISDTPMLCSQRIPTPLGPMVIVVNERGLALCEFTDRPLLPTQMRRIQSLLGGMVIVSRHDHLDHARRELDEYFSGKRQRFTVPLVLDGTPFQQDVWHELYRIPFGQTASYKAIACGIGRPNAVRAVAGANADNRLSIIVPCHRVIHADGSLSGYGGGRHRQRWLLAHEQGACQLSLPTVGANGAEDADLQSVNPR